MAISYRSSPSIAIMPDDAKLYDKALKISEKLAIPLLHSETEDVDLIIICSAAGLALKQTAAGSPGAVMASFTSPTIQYRIRQGGGKKQAIARAVGLKKGWQPKVIDATAGLGRDSFILAWLGCHVHMIERSPVLAALLKDAIQQAENSVQVAEVVKNRLKFTQADSKHFLQELKPSDYPDVIYLDPMYPDRPKSSLVKKEMRLLRKVAGADPDADALLPLALSRVLNRVVVKRPRLAKILGRLEPSHQITGKSSRFDVYLV